MKNHIKAIIIAVLFVFMMFLQASAQKKPFRNIDFSQHDFVDEESETVFAYEVRDILLIEGACGFTKEEILTILKEHPEQKLW